MKVGQKKIIEYICCERKCDECGDKALYKHTFLFFNSRRDPDSKGYRKDDLTWCEDESNYACDKHKFVLIKNPPTDDVQWNSTFSINKFPHFFLFWKKTKEEVIDV